MLYASLFRTTLISQELLASPNMYLKSYYLTVLETVFENYLYCQIARPFTRFAVFEIQAVAKARATAKF